MLNTLKAYLSTRLELAGLQAQHVATVMFTLLTHLVLQGILLLVALLLLGIALGFAMAAWVDNLALGFACAGIFFLLMGVIIYFCKKRIRNLIYAHLERLINQIILTTASNDTAPEHADPHQGSEKGQ